MERGRSPSSNRRGQRRAAAAFPGPLAATSTASLAEIDDDARGLSTRDFHELTASTSRAAACFRSPSPRLGPPNTTAQGPALAIGIDLGTTHSLGGLHRAQRRAAPGHWPDEDPARLAAALGGVLRRRRAPGRPRTCSRASGRASPHPSPGAVEHQALHGPRARKTSTFAHPYRLTSGEPKQRLRWSASTSPTRAPRRAPVSARRRCPRAGPARPSSRAGAGASSAPKVDRRGHHRARLLRRRLSARPPSDAGRIAGLAGLPPARRADRGGPGLRPRPGRGRPGACSRSTTWAAWHLRHLASCACATACSRSSRPAATRPWAATTSTAPSGRIFCAKPRRLRRGPADHSPGPAPGSSP